MPAQASLAENRNHFTSPEVGVNVVYEKGRANAKNTAKESYQLAKGQRPHKMLREVWPGCQLDIPHCLGKLDSPALPLCRD